MAAKKPGRVGTLTSIFFTSLVCPLLVHVLIRAVEVEVPPQAQAQTVSRASMYGTPVAEQRLIAQGVGETPDAAWDDAVRYGLRTAVLGQLEGPVRAQEASNTLALVLEDTRGLVTHCEDLECSGSAGFWRRKVALTLDRTALAGRVRAARLRAGGLGS